MKHSPPHKPVTNPLARRLAAYSAVAAATTATTGHAGASEVVWDITDLTVTTSAPSAGVFFNMLNGNTTPATYVNSDTYNIFYDFTPGKFRLDPRFEGYIYGPAYDGGVAGALGFVGATDTVTSTTLGGGTNQFQLAYANPLGNGVAINGGQDFVLKGPWFSNFYASLNFTDGQTGHVGIRFELSGNTHFGWAQITRDNGSTFTLHGFGYNNTPNAPSITASTVDGALDPADLDQDGDVDDADFGIAFAAFTGPNAGPSNNPAADLDADGDVDDADFGIAFAAFTGPGGSASVPEPNSLVLLALGAAGLAGWRKRTADAH